MTIATMQPTIQFQDATFKLQRMETQKGWVFAWSNESAMLVSPVFNTVQCAMEYAAVMPLLTDEQWQKREVEFRKEWREVKKEGE